MQDIKSADVSCANLINMMGWVSISWMVSVAMVGGGVLTTMQGEDRHQVFCSFLITRSIGIPIVESTSRACPLLCL